MHSLSPPGPALVAPEPKSLTKAQSTVFSCVTWRPGHAPSTPDHGSHPSKDRPATVLTMDRILVAFDLSHGQRNSQKKPRPH